MQRQQGIIQTLESQVQRQQGTIQTLESQMQVLRILHMTDPKLQYSLQELRIDQAHQMEELQSKDSEIRRLREELRKVDKVNEKVFWKEVSVILLFLAGVPSCHLRGGRISWCGNQTHPLTC